MEITRPGHEEISPEEKAELQKLKEIIERAVADGKISRQEYDNIHSQIKSDGKITVEELGMYRRLVTDKVSSGELTLDY